MLRVTGALLVTAVLVLVPRLGLADVVSPPPTDCPAGHQATSDHAGPYCRPPKPTDCPPSHRPLVVRDKGYCEPPPSKACPKGSFYTSESATDTFCMAAARCDSSACRSGMACIETDLCVTHRPRSGGIIELVSGTCPAGSCAAGKCLKSKRCHADIVQTNASATPEGSAAPEPSASASTAPEPSASASAAPELSASAAPSVTPESTPAAPPAAPAPGCGCVVVGHRPSSTAAALALLALAMAGLARRRPRPW